MSEQASPIFGIDLGTTYSCIAYVDEYGRPTAIANTEGSRTTPSVVFFDEENRVVGEEAKNNAVLFPKEVVEMVKRQMGQPDWLFFYQDTEYSAEEISSYILRKMVRDAEEALGISISDVVITCPAYFGINEREATARAGEIAGLNVRSIINEPTAAAIAYGLHETEDQVVLVYDLGGGTFDITMIDIKGGEINVIATGGDHQLGGKDWDSTMVTYLAAQWQAKTGSDEEPLEDLETLQHLWQEAEKAKKTLSVRNKSAVAVMHGGQRERVVLTREKFNELTAHLLERTIEYTHQMLKEAAKKGYTRFDRILLVGGSTRMPQVAERLQAEFGIEPQLHDPDEAVAKGAAIYAQKLAIGDQIKVKMESWGINKEEATDEEIERAQQEVADELGFALPSVKQYEELIITNVTSRSFGVVALDANGNELVFNLIRLNDTVPAETTQRFGTVANNQEQVNLRIMENLISDETTELAVSEEIGNAVLSLPFGLPKGSPLEITFRLNEQGRLHGMARELSANRTIEVEIETSRIISQEQLAEAKSRATQILVS